MDTLLLAGVVVVALFLLLALFARGGATEPVTPRGLPPEAAGIAKLTLPELASITTRLFNELGFAKVSQDDFPNRCDLVMEDPTPITGQRVYIRAVQTPESGAVESAEVQAALDTARGGSLSKAIVVTTGPFSDEARLLSKDTALELIDGGALAQMVRTHLPDVANRLGLPR
jgi:hypothetical protein